MNRDGDRDRDKETAEVIRSTHVIDHWENEVELGTRTKNLGKHVKQRRQAENGSVLVSCALF